MSRHILAPMADLVLALGTIAIVVAVIVTVTILWGLARTFRAVRRSAGRATRRIQGYLPQQGLGSQTWWLAGRLDRVEEKAGYACVCSARTFLEDDVRALAGELHAAAAAVRMQVQAASRLSGDSRLREADRLEAAVVELEGGATQLVVTATRLSAYRTGAEGVGSGEHVRRRAHALDMAVQELAALDPTDPATTPALPAADPLADGLGALRPEAQRRA